MKTKIVLVEDNLIALRALRETIDWDSLDCEVAGTARDGEAGKELILSVQPDILLTDIRMPRKDGLQMLAEVRDSVPEMKTIVITGYDQFEYTSRAIRLAVSDYILKPIRNEEVVNALRRTLQLIRRQQTVNRELEQEGFFKGKAQLLSLLTNPSHTGQDVHAMLEGAGLCSPAFYLMLVQPRDSRALSLAVLSGVDDLLAGCGANALSVMLYDTLVIYAMRQDTGDAWQDEAERIAECLRRMLPVQADIGVSRLTSSHHQVRQAYQQARQALLESIVGPDTGESFRIYDLRCPLPGGKTNALMRQVDSLIESAELTPESAARAAAELTRLGGGMPGSIRALVSLYALMLCRKFPCPSTPEVEQAMNDLWYLSGEREPRQGLESLCRALSSARQAQPEENYSLLTRSVLEYIRLHCTESPKLYDVAQKFHVSVNYLSALISRETGISFHEHILRAKMDIAHTMLADPRILVEEVARAVGYSTYISFYNVFKRMEHMTPSEYRNKLAGLEEVDSVR